MTPTGAHGVAIDPACRDPVAPSALYGVVQTSDDWPGSGESGHEKAEKPFCQVTRFPAGAIENLVKGTEGVALGVAGNAQARRYGSFARRQQSTRHKNEHIPPGWSGKGGAERVQPVDKEAWNGCTGVG